MEFTGEIVKHKVFGSGKVVERKGNYIKILFNNISDEKDFVYPDAFGSYLKLENKVLLNQVEKDLDVVIKREAENMIREAELKEQSRKIVNSEETSKEMNTATNISFKCNYSDGGRDNESVGYKAVCSNDTINYNINKAKQIWCSNPESVCFQYQQGTISREELVLRFNEDKYICHESQMLRQWRVYAGVNKTGVNKGKPIKLSNVKTNSLAMLTTRLPKDKEKDRFIFAVFLILENYEGNYNEEGYIDANQKYRIELSLDEAKELKFWDYYFNNKNPGKMLFGSGLHRYFTDVQAAQVLKKICEIKKGNLDEEISIEFLEHFCEIKNIDIKEIPMPNGALKRIV